MVKQNEKTGFLWVRKQDFLHFRILLQGVLCTSSVKIWMPVKKNIYPETFLSHQKMSDWVHFEAYCIRYQGLIQFENQNMVTCFLLSPFWWHLVITATRYKTYSFLLPWSLPLRLFPIYIQTGYALETFTAISATGALTGVSEPHQTSRSAKSNAAL